MKFTTLIPLVALLALDVSASPLNQQRSPALVAKSNANSDAHANINGLTNANANANKQVAPATTDDSSTSDPTSAWNTADATSVWTTADATSTGFAVPVEDNLSGGGGTRYWKKK